MLCEFYRYLMKDQLKGKSSVEAYINVLKRGCKCVERKWIYIIGFFPLNDKTHKHDKEHSFFYNLETFFVLRGKFRYQKNGCASLQANYRPTYTASTLLYSVCASITAKVEHIGRRTWYIVFSWCQMCEKCTNNSTD